MVFITGDCHGDFGKFSTRRFPIQKGMTRDDIVIVCGDFGIWHDSKDERERLKWLEEKPFTLAFVDGNHENFDRLYGDEFPVTDFHGGMAHRIRENVFHLMRGQVFDFEGRSFWCFGGARSHDIQDGILDRDDYESDDAFLAAIREWYAANKWFRINHVSWWRQELPTREEMDAGLKALQSRGNEVDYIISHCCPQEVASAMGFHESDTLTAYFNEIAHNVRFTRWFFGHYHGEETIFGKFVLLYDTIERVL